MSIVIPTIASVATAVAAADHFLANSKAVIQNSVGPFLWALITRQPWKAVLHQEEEKMLQLSGITSFFAGLKEELVKAEPIMDECLTLIDKAAKLSEVIAPFCGQAAPAVAEGAKIADGLDLAIKSALEAHIAAGSTPESAAVATSAVLQAVAASGVVSDTGHVAELQNIAAIVTALNPAAQNLDP